MAVHFPQSLLKAVKKGACIAFVGSGLSIPAGMPSWRQLLTLLIEEGEKEGLIQHGPQLRKELDSDHFLEVSEYIRLRLGPHLYSSIIRRLFDVQAEPTAGHQVLVDTPYRAIITTNYDKMLETAYTLKHRRTPRKITWSHPESLGAVLYDEDFFIFKLHGTLIILSRSC